MLEPGFSRSPRQVKKYDVIYASEFRLPGKETYALIEEIRARSDSGAKIGVMRLDWHKHNPKKPIARQFRDMLNDDIATIIAYPEEAKADLVILAFPPAIEVWRRWMPRIHTDKVAIICGQNCISGSADKGELIFNVDAVDGRVVEEFGVRGVWHPTCVESRRALEAAGADIIILPDNRPEYGIIK